MKRRKKRTQEEIKIFKRKRGRILQERARRCEYGLFRTDDAQRIWKYSAIVLTPLLLADVARRLGSHSIAPRDYYCGCGPSYKDGMPICEQRMENCRFAATRDPEWVLQREGKADVMKYDRLWDKAVQSFTGRWMVRAIDIPNRCDPDNA